MRALRALALAATALAGATLVSALAPAGAQPATVVLQAGLAGAREVPGPGDRDGSGFARVEVDPAAGTICWELTVRNIAPATAAHIHEGARDVAGPVVQGLQAPTSGSSAGCVTRPDVAQRVAADPAGFYVNVHNGEFPGGAVRGQLAGPAS
jgi:hypothetical protein